MVRRKDVKFISLIGILDTVLLKSMSVFNYSTEDIPYLNVFWMYDNYQKYASFHEIKPRSCSTVYKIIRGIVCFNFTFSRNQRRRYTLLSFSRARMKKSWNEASELCRNIDAYLPIIENREDLEELIAFIKLSGPLVPPGIEQLYLGLKVYPNEVSSISMFYQCVFGGGLYIEFCASYPLYLLTHHLFVIRMVQTLKKNIY